MDGFGYSEHQPPAPTRDTSPPTGKLTPPPDGLDKNDTKTDTYDKQLRDLRRDQKVAATSAAGIIALVALVLIGILLFNDFVPASPRPTESVAIPWQQ